MVDKKNIILARTNSQSTDFLKLVARLDRELLDMYGNEMDFYAQYNKVDYLNHCIVAYDENVPVACGAIKEYSPGVAEVKRMFVDKQHRGLGISAKVLAGLELWAAELSYRSVILETGDLQHAAIGLYRKMNYLQTENYGQYVNAPSSICFIKQISSEQ